MEKGENRYKGLNTDIAYDSIGGGYYIDAINLRITTTEGESQSAITNFKGNKFYFTVPQFDTNIPTATGIVEIIGVAYIRNIIILFTTDDSGSNGWVVKLLYDEVSGELTSTPEVIYSNSAFGFKKEFPIEALGRYESGCMQRVYWTDYNNYFRSINIADVDLYTQDLGTIDIFPNIEYTQPLLTNVQGGGQLPVGTYEYAYRLTTSDGKQSLISPPSKLIHCTQDSEGVPQTAQYYGSPQGTNSGKANEITIDVTNYLIFESIELIAIFHDSYTGTPEVTSVESQVIGTSSTSIVFLHTGAETSTVVLELFDYATKQHPFKTFKTLTSKDNSLIPANLKGSDFDAQDLLTIYGEFFDARTMRYSRAGALDSTLLDPDPEIQASQLSFNTSYNLDAHWDWDWHVNQQFKFQDTSALVLGGTGVNSGISGMTLGNVSYTFHLEPFVIDSNEQADFTNNSDSPINFPDLANGYGPYPNTTFDSHASPFRSGVTRGYKRGETYRFGIVFYNKKGEASFVEHIGDIKFPDVCEESEDTSNNNSGRRYHPLSRETSREPGQIVTTAYALGIKFNIDFSSCPNFIANEVSGYQIVRLDRTTADSRRICSGIMRNFTKWNLVSQTDPGFVVGDDDYNLGGTEGADNILHLYPYLNNWGSNANFTTLNDTYRASGGLDELLPGTGGNFGSSPAVYGNWLTYYSPDISYNWGTGIRDVVEGAPNALLLMTGRYAQYMPTESGTIPNITTPDAMATFYENSYADSFSYTLFTSINENSPGTANDSLPDLGARVDDQRRKLRTTGTVNKKDAIGIYLNDWERGIEYVKQWKEKNLCLFDGTNTIDSVTSALGVALGPYQGSDPSDVGTTEYMRNFYIYLRDTTMGINDLKSTERDVTGTGTDMGKALGNSILNKGATGITGTMEKITTDPITGAPLPGPTQSTDWYKAELGSLLVDPISDREPVYGYSTPVDPVPVLFSAGTDSYALAAGKTSTPLIDTLIPKTEVYGGYSQDALETNTFYPASGVLDVTELQPIVFGGDIFLNMFLFQDQCTFNSDSFYYEASNSNPRQRYSGNTSSTTSFVIESRTNIKLAFGANIASGVQHQVSGGPSGFTRTVYRQETDNTNIGYATSGSMYTSAYNGAYSAGSTQLAFFVKPANFEGSCNNNDIRAFISNVKENEEAIDSWTKFGVNNYYDVDDYGPINKVVNHKDEVYFFQDRGVGRYSINPRAIVSTEDGIPTELGSGEGFRDHTYITTQYGSIHQWAVKDTDIGIYFYDAIHRKIFRIGQNQKGEGNSISSPLSEIKGIHSLLSNFDGNILLRKENGGDNPIKEKGVHIGRDLVNNEILFTFSGAKVIKELATGITYYSGNTVFANNNYYEVTTNFTAAGPYPNVWFSQLENNSILLKGEPIDTYTLVFDELVGEFSSSYTSTPSIYIENGDILLSPDPDNRQSVYQHNEGNFGEFYGQIEESSIKLVLNKHADINKILRFVEFNSIVRDTQKTIDRDLTITAFKVETEYQTTNKINVSSNRIKRRFDKWRLKIPRNQTGTKKDRLRSTHFVLTLYFDNTYNKELILNKIHSYFDIQMY